MSTPNAGPFGPVQQVAAGVLEVGYVDLGPPGGRAVLLLHGWPYDIHSYADAAPALAAAGYRVIVPYLRGYGPHAVPFRRDSAKRTAGGASRIRIHLTDSFRRVAVALTCGVTRSLSACLGAEWERR